VDGAAGECELAGALAALPGAARRPSRRDLELAAHAAGASPPGAVKLFSSPSSSGRR
jgi:hypothetical protein